MDHLTCDSFFFSSELPWADPFWYVNKQHAVLLFENKQHLINLLHTPVTQSTTLRPSASVNHALLLPTVVVGSRRIRTIGIHLAGRTPEGRTMSKGRRKCICRSDFCQNNGAVGEVRVPRDRRYEFQQALGLPNELIPRVWLGHFMADDVEASK